MTAINSENQPIQSMDVVPMKNSNWKDAAELLGIVAIVGSLIFVGLQMKQSQDIAIATQYQARAEAVQNLQLASMEADWVGVRELRSAISDDISARDINLTLWLWIQFDNHFYQYKAGFLDEDAWQGQWRNIKAIYSQCDMRFVWDWRKAGLRSEFVALVELMRDPCKGEQSQ